MTLALLTLLIVAGAGWAAWLGSAPFLQDRAHPDASATATAQATVDAREPVGEEAGTAGDDGRMRRLPGDSGAQLSTIYGADGTEVTTITPAARDRPGPVVLTPPNRVGQDPRLAHLPDPAITESTPAGDLPMVGAAGERAFDIYARPWSGARGTRVAIVVGGLGISQTGTQYALSTLPKEITLAFAANGNSLRRWMQQARRDGREILLQVPFEPYDYPRNDPGRGTLTVAAGAEENLADLHEAMGRITNYTGITNFTGGRFLADAGALEPVMRDIADRGIMFLDDGTSARSLAGRFATTFGVPFAASDMVIDATQERGYVLGKLDELERVARRNGSAIGVASAFRVSVETIAAWADEAKARGIEIVGASALADDPLR